MRHDKQWEATLFRCGVDYSRSAFENYIVPDKGSFAIDCGWVPYTDFKIAARFSAADFDFSLADIMGLAGYGDKKVKVDKMIQVVDGSFVISTNSDYAAASVQSSLSRTGLRYGYSVTVDGSVVRVKMN